MLVAPVHFPSSSRPSSPSASARARPPASLPPLFFLLPAGPKGSASGQRAVLAVARQAASQQLVVTSLLGLHGGGAGVLGGAGRGGGALPRGRRGCGWGGERRGGVDEAAAAAAAAAAAGAQPPQAPQQGAARHHRGTYILGRLPFLQFPAIFSLRRTASAPSSFDAIPIPLPRVPFGFLRIMGVRIQPNPHLGGNERKEEVLHFAWE